MKTIEQAAKEYSKKVNGDYYNELYPNCDETIGEVTEKEFKAGIEFAQRWIPIKEELPMAYETGGWDGKRSDFVLAKNIHGSVFVARTYHGFIDGSKFCDFADRNDTILSHIINWRPIELK